MTQVAKSHDERAIVLAPAGRDAPLISSTLERCGVSAHSVASAAEVAEALDRGAGVLVVAEEALTPEAMLTLAGWLSRQPTWSDLPVVLLSAATTHGPSSNTRRYDMLGNVTVLERPMRPVTLERAVLSALRVRRRQYAAREVLRQQERAVRQRDEFLALLGHELRNPLSAISTANAVVAKACATCGLAPAAKNSEIVRRQTRQLTRLVDDLLDVARVTTGKLTLQRAPVDLRSVVERYLASVAPTVEAHGLQLHGPRPGAPLILDGDAARLEQIVANLLGNAMKFTPAGGRIDVDVEESQGNAILRVRDNGVGIPAEMLEEIFDIFTQAHADLARRRGGLGLGLTLVRTLTHLHGGDVTVTSPGPGRGSEFVVRFPLAQPVQMPAVRDEASSEGAAPLTLLVVEDNEDSLESLRDVLEIEGHRVEIASDGIAGVERALAVEPDVGFIDIGLPGIDGYEVARRIRARLGSSVYLVALTGYGQPEDQHRALEAGFDLHVTKPPEIEKLQEILSRRRPADTRGPLPA